MVDGDEFIKQRIDKWLTSRWCTGGDFTDIKRLLLDFYNHLEECEEGRMRA